ncbi:SMI1/KNR4 family protein [Streptomyces sp. NPDC087440]|uniref:Lsr2 family DNA-binding protein n=1 Tax=Streptomyces sp. NPDC087440 TaxID=3365790 RepID=UPI00380D2864
MLRAWARISAWLEAHAPEVHARLGGPGDADSIHAAEGHMGVRLTPAVRQFLLAHDAEAGRRDAPRTTLVAYGCAGVTPSWSLLGLTDIERVHAARMDLAALDRSLWRREWLPIVAEDDGLYGTFLDTRTGTVGSWSESEGPEEAVHPSLSAYLTDIADGLEGIRPPHQAQDRDLEEWTRENGIVVNYRGRIPAHVREAYPAAEEALEPEGGA